MNGQFFTVRTDDDDPRDHNDPDSKGSGFTAEVRSDRHYQSRSGLQGHPIRRGIQPDALKYTRSLAPRSFPAVLSANTTGLRGSGNERDSFTWGVDSPPGA